MMILRELFDKVDNYEWVERSPNQHYVAKFTIGHEKFTWSAEMMDEEYNSWDIQFTVEAISRAGVVGQSAKKTGSNQEYKVFQTVISIMNDFLHSGEKINVLAFSADEPNRQKLYKHMVNRLLPDWDMRMDDEYGVFVVKRPGFTLDTDDYLTEGEGVKLGHVCKVGTNFADADFWLKRKGDRSEVGRVMTDFAPQHIGIKVERVDVLDAKYLYYLMMHKHSSGYWASRSNGMLQLQNITVSDVKDVKL